MFNELGREKRYIANIHAAKKTIGKKKVKGLM
ncbi:MAG: hypothetical protein A4E62_03087 [Syntrophorhabdus sp. PtaU1.Bin002]|nr:MAG: hypothetical protein A4E62_03087 [Syntrophorhabdus sp. PtaU1.Bin002]